MILISQRLKEIISGNQPMIFSEKPISEDQIQPASIDCRLGERVFRMSTSMLPAKEKIEDLIARYAIYDFEIKEGSVLEPRASYLVPLEEEFNLPVGFSVIFSPKSSIGRVDVFVRVLSDFNPAYNCVKSGYKGKIYLEIVPLSFMVGITPQLKMIQMRIRAGSNSLLSNEDLRIIQSKDGIIFSNSGKIISFDDFEVEENRLCLHVDLDREIIGFQAMENPTQKLDLFRNGYYDWKDFWIPIPKPKNGEFVLAPGHFYLLCSRERVKIPKDCCAEIIEYDPTVGEFRSHYAGFFDNNFGGEGGTNAVLEVRARDNPFRLYDGQPICRMIFERTMGVPDKLYGQEIGSHYIGSGPRLSKIFKEVVW